MRYSRIKKHNCIIIIDKDHTNDNVESCLRIFHGHVIHTSTRLILSCWSSHVGATVGSLIHTLNCTLVRLLLWTLVSKMPILPIVETGSLCYGILSNIVSMRWRRCRAMRLKISVLNLTLRNLESLRCTLHPWLLLTRTEGRSLGR
jgi:hypothetical protein